jgi:dimethylargininase
MRDFALPSVVLVRGVPARFEHALRSRPVTIDVERARAQHAAYVAALAALTEVRTVAADEAHPDCCFIEDAAVITGRHALLTRPGAESRRGEETGVAAPLLSLCTLQRMTAPATLDGGDVLRVGDHLFVGLSQRTNRAGAEALRELAALDGLRTYLVEVRGGLHLKSACSLADARTLVYLDGAVDPAWFAPCAVETVSTDEALGANVLAIGSRVFVSADAPATAERLRRRGLDVVALELSEFHNADGALTCLSLRVPAAGAWST